MAKVIIYKLQNDGSQAILAVCELIDGIVICKGDVKFVNYLLKEGIKDYSENPTQRVFPQDGLRFLTQLKNNFHSGYLIASDIKQE